MYRIQPCRRAPGSGQRSLTAVFHLKVGNLPDMFEEAKQSFLVLAVYIVTVAKENGFEQASRKALGELGPAGIRASCYVVTGWYGSMPWLLHYLFSFLFLFFFLSFSFSFLCSLTLITDYYARSI